METNEQHNNDHKKYEYKVENVNKYKVNIQTSKNVQSLQNKMYDKQSSRIKEINEDESHNDNKIEDSNENQYKSESESESERQCESDNEDECESNYQFMFEQNDQKEYQTENKKIISKNNNTLIKKQNNSSQHITNTDKEKDEYRELIKILIEQNTNLQTLIKDMIPKLGTNNTIINNGKINMTLFLEQQCKSAPNMKDFIAGMQIEVSDLLHTRDKGIVNGITHIFLNSLRQLDIYQRPIHCTDMKRQTLYIKDDDEWQHGEKGRQIFSNAIQDIQAKHTKTIPEWEKEHPDWSDSDKLTEDYMKMVKYSTQSIEFNSNDENKIIRNIAKEVILDKKILQIDDS